MHAPKKSVDVFIGIFGKPYQTALSLLSLLRHSGEYIDRIYFLEEPATPEMERHDHRRLLEYLGDRVIRFMPAHWLGPEVVDEKRILHDEAYRLSVRYQYGWEQSDKTFALIIHNDIEVTGDIVGELLGNIGEATAIGGIGQCWWCPAGQKGLCSPTTYESYRPDYEELMRLYREDVDLTSRRAYHLGLRSEFHDRAWPLPECRLNEWGVLLNLDKARPATLPLGPAAPYGAIFASGAKIGPNRDQDVELDIGVSWFRDMTHLGHTFAHYPVERFITHARQGHCALFDPELYIRKELEAKLLLLKHYPEYASGASG